MSKEFYFVDRLQNLLQKSLKELLLLWFFKDFGAVEETYCQIIGNNFSIQINISNAQRQADNDMMYQIYHAVISSIDSTKFQNLYKLIHGRTTY